MTTITEAADVLRYFVGAAYPVHNAINARGYVWSEAYLDEALTAYRALAAHLAQPEQAPATTIADNSQNWAGMSGTDAYLMVQRHADGWADVGKMMGEWLAANQGAALAAREPMTEDEVLQRWHQMPKHHRVVEFARSIERHHGIGAPAQKGGEHV